MIPLIGKTCLNKSIFKVRPRKFVNNYHLAAIEKVNIFLGLTLFELTFAICYVELRDLKRLLKSILTMYF